MNVPHVGTVLSGDVRLIEVEKALIHGAKRRTRDVKIFNEIFR